MSVSTLKKRAAAIDVQIKRVQQRCNHSFRLVSPVAEDQLTVQAAPNKTFVESMAEVVCKKCELVSQRPMISFCPRCLSHMASLPGNGGYYCSENQNADIRVRVCSNPKCGFMLIAIDPLGHD
jgi:Zn finger protein HypA/HybF involved in hydrogenase expression